MENKEIQKEVYVLNSIKRLKHYVAIFAFGSPFIHFGFNFLISVIAYLQISKQSHTFLFKFHTILMHFRQ